MSKIVVLVGSVRKDGNTEILARAFSDGANNNHEVEIISVADYEVNPCIGCNMCFKTEGNACVQNDDMQVVYKNLAEADVLVIASPVYFYGISAQLKAIIDRLHSPLRNTFKVKKLGLLLVAGAALPNVFESIELQYQLVLDYFNLQDVGRIFVNGVSEKGDIKGNQALDDAYELGRHIKLEVS
ncbi:MAG: flavodoxin family protein [Lachnospiraceae bacterium]|nr:flavodoxin family protein [Lachnospiraceae bacterium]